jgi:anaerobic ribonucleoside-triphosphate reductase activating protein
MIIDGVTVEADVSIPQEVLVQEVANERVLWLAKNKVLGRIVFTIDKDGEIDVVASSKEPIRRLRRITGYLSNVDNFNDAKKIEMEKRFIHFNG